MRRPTSTNAHLDGRSNYLLPRLTAMPDISLTTVALLCLAALAAGWIDAVVREMSGMAVRLGSG